MSLGANPSHCDRPWHNTDQTCSVSELAFIKAKNISQLESVSNFATLNLHRMPLCLLSKQLNVSLLIDELPLSKFHSSGIKRKLYHSPKMVEDDAVPITFGR
jgi:hypothetical protein